MFVACMKDKKYQQIDPGLQLAFSFRFLANNGPNDKGEFTKVTQSKTSLFLVKLGPEGRGPSKKRFSLDTIRGANSFL